jgi:hypothetical protein
MPHQSDATALWSGIEKGNLHLPGLERICVVHSCLPSVLVNGGFVQFLASNLDPTSSINFDFIGDSQRNTWLIVCAEVPKRC